MLLDASMFSFGYFKHLHRNNWQVMASFVIPAFSHANQMGILVFLPFAG